MKTPRVSVIMPAYNSEKYISEAIESILNQTFTDFEFIILNDGSTDNTQKIVKEYAKKDKRIKFIDNKKNKGLVSVLNQGIDLAQGEYIARMDSDDISLPTRFEKQIEYMDKHPECGILGTWYKVFGKKEEEVKHPLNIKILDLMDSCYIGHPTVFIRKSVLDKYNFKYNKEYNCCEDYELWSCLVFVTEIHNLPEILLKYRWHGNNISVEHAKKQGELTKNVKKNILNKLTDNPIKQQILLNKIKQGILLPKWIGKIICLFIFKRKKRHNFRKKYVKGY